MFFRGSRYESISETSLLAKDGRAIRYKRMRRAACYKSTRRSAAYKTESKASSNWLTTRCAQLPLRQAGG